MTTVVLVDEAEEQLQEIIAWWIENRTGPPTLALDEFERCVNLLESRDDDLRPRGLDEHSPIPADLNLSPLDAPSSQHALRGDLYAVLIHGVDIILTVRSWLAAMTPPLP
jgi:hypothetical protein